MIWKICCGAYFRHFCKSSSEIPALSIWLHTYTHVNANSGKVHCLAIAILYGNILSLHMCKATRTPTCKQTDVAKVAITRLLLATSCCSVVFYKLWNRLHDRSSPFKDRAESVIVIVNDEVPWSASQPPHPSVSKVQSLQILQCWTLLTQRNLFSGMSIIFTFPMQCHYHHCILGDVRE